VVVEMFFDLRSLGRHVKGPLEAITVRSPHMMQAWC
jgi:hypothetical protein